MPSKLTLMFVRRPFGIGKTTFVKKVFTEMGIPDVSISFQDPPHKMAEDFLKQVGRHQIERMNRR